MGGVDVGTTSNKRAMNADLNMVPFIDLLMVTITFLLLTAVWVTNSRLEVNAQVPGQAGCGEACAAETALVLHVHLQEDGFGLTWKQGPTVVSEVKIQKQEVQVGSDSMTAIRYPGLAETIQSEWKRAGAHRDVSDRKVDQAVLHTENGTPFREVVAALDAISSARREMSLPNGNRQLVAAFSTTFASR
ncbi:biopolymer transporter ExbD [Chondromyces apiculatus]|uniref:TolR protein n=1 Tax=Chondromyces apiculatus DSM 436 TaxID=1192034 RepID=A0A017T0F1_9BACT|nr:biopolymer transporter ExbD [Chondromyces apiculatus]EYF02693.1 TolR protein [Chondromyces apiculatus DSM 436]